MTPQNGIQDRSSTGSSSLLTDGEHRSLVVEYNQSAAPYPADAGIVALFEAQVARTPAKEAIRMGDRALTYRELNERANQMAAHLRALGAGPDRLVALYMEHSIEVVCAILGVLKAGAAYVPVDPASTPKERLAFILQDIAEGLDRSLPVLMTHSQWLDRIPDTAGPVVALDTGFALIEKYPVSNPAPAASPSNLAYVIYTSGSTGKPKGVLIERRSLVNYIWWAHQSYGQGEPLSWPLFSSLAFDLTVTSIFTPLISGGRIVVYREDSGMQAMVIRAVIEDNAVDIVKLTPSHLAMIEDMNLRDTKICKFIVGGENFKTELARAITDKFGRPVEIYNEYGPTEATVGCMIYRYDANKDRALSVPIGVPAANAGVYILDEHHRPVPSGVIGEMYLAGDGLARGYLNRAELTAEKFLMVEDPRQHGSAPLRLYRTGDLARWSPDGRMECLGRADDQVKIGGMRIELGEIEGVLGSHSEVRHCAAIAREGHAGDKQLVVYFEAQPDSTPDPGELRAFMERELPAYMIPSAFVAMEKLPLTPNGKIDRNALPDPAESAVPASNFVPPQNPSEQMLAQIWTKILKLKRVGRHDDFFELGGQSLLAVRLINEIEKLTNLRLPLATLLQAPTIAELADLLQRENWAPSWSSLVPIRPAGSRPPLFLMHAHGGNVLEYYPLANLQEPDQPVYALQARGLDGNIAEDSSIEKMAAAYIKEMRSLQPEGPYFLGGFCLGGFLALEAAKQLTAAGQEVAVVVLIQSMHPEAMRFRPDTTVLERLWYRVTKQVSLEMDNLSHKRKGYIVERIRHVYDVLRARTAIAIDQRTGRQPKDLTKLPMQYILEVLRVEHGKAIEQWAPPSYRGEVVLFRATKQLSGVGADECLGWNRIFNGNLVVREVPGHQQNLLLEPNVVRLSKEVARALNEAHKRLQAGE